MSSEGNNPRILVISYRFAPSQTPTAIILHQLFQHFPRASCVVASGPAVNVDETLDLGMETYRLGPGFAAKWIERVYARSGPLPITSVYTWLYAIARRVRPTHIYLHYPDPVFAIAGARVAQQLGIPYVVYFDITWRNNPGFRYRQLSRFQRYVARGASHCFAITDVLQREVEEISGRGVELLPHTITEVPDVAPALNAAADNVIHLAGSLYPKMNVDAVQRLVRVLPELPGAPRLEIFGRNEDEALTRYGILKAGVTSGLVTRTELFAAQRKSRMLFLPFSFEPENSAMITANFPTRAMEYLVSGVPILIHAPATSQLSLWAREYGWAHVVDEASDAALREGARRVLEDETLRATLVERAFAFVQSRDAKTHSARLQKALGLAPNSPPSTGST